MSDVITVVSGLPRSGTSMMMQLIEKAGVQIFTDENRVADKSNPNGYYEHDGVKGMMSDNKFLSGAKGKGVKIISQLIPYLDLDLEYRVVIINRSLNEIVRSQQVMLGKDPEAEMGSVKRIFRNQRDEAKKFLTKNNIPFIEINHQDLFKDPNNTLTEFVEFLGYTGEIEDLSSVIDTKLYRQQVEGDDNVKVEEADLIKLEDIIKPEDQSYLKDIKPGKIKKSEEVKPGDKYEIPLAGSLGLLAYGDIGLKMWRRKIRVTKAAKRAAKKGTKAK